MKEFHFEGFNHEIMTQLLEHLLKVYLQLQCNWANQVDCKIDDDDGDGSSDDEDQDSSDDDGDESSDENDNSSDEDESSDEKTYGDKDVVCYFINWAWYRTGDGKYSADDVDPTLCTIINYAFAVLENNKIKVHDPWADTDVGGGEFFKKIIALKNRPGSRVGKVLLAIGGWNDSAGSKYSVLAKSSQLRSVLLSTV